MSPRIELPDESLVLLVGAAGSGKSTFAARHFTATQVVSSDRMRALIGDDPGDRSPRDVVGLRCCRKYLSYGDYVMVIFGS